MHAHSLCICMVCASEGESELFDSQPGSFIDVYTHKHMHGYVYAHAYFNVSASSQQLQACRLT